VHLVVCLLILLMIDCCLAIGAKWWVPHSSGDLRPGLLA